MARLEMTLGTRNIHVVYFHSSSSQLYADVIITAITNTEAGKGETARSKLKGDGRVQINTGIVNFLHKDFRTVPGSRGSRISQTGAPTPVVAAKLLL